jgi:hypothetical protein
LRNGVAAEGIFLSTTIRAIGVSGEVLTANSVYRIAELQAAGRRH